MIALFIEALEEALELLGSRGLLGGRACGRKGVVIPVAKANHALTNMPEKGLRHGSASRPLCQYAERLRYGGTAGITKPAYRE